jgi:hypothetical protein
MIFESASNLTSNRAEHEKNRPKAFTSFRHGGFTEAADSDLSDAEIRAAGRHKSAKVLPRYAKRTMNQVAAGAKKRRAQRERE